MNRVGVDGRAGAHDANWPRAGGDRFADVAVGVSIAQDSLVKMTGAMPGRENVSLSIAVRRSLWVSMRFCDEVNLVSSLFVQSDQLAGNPPLDAVLVQLVVMRVQQSRSAR